MSAPSLRALYLSRVEGCGVGELRAEHCAPRIARRESRARGARLEAHDELVPEAGVRPVLDGEGGADRDVRVLRAVDLVELVAEVERRRGAVAALAEVFELEADRLADVEQPLEVRGAVLVDAALDGARDRHEARVEAGGVARRGRRLLLPLVEDDADLVGEDLLALAHVVERRRVDDLVELRDEEEVGEYGAATPI